MSELHAALAGMQFGKPLRRYQQLAIEAFERQRAAGGKRAYLVLPPGSGKTAPAAKRATVKTHGMRSTLACRRSATR